MTNVVAGDLARIVHNSHGQVDKLVWVEERSYKFSGGPWWRCKAFSPTIRAWDGSVGENDFYIIADRDLRPIRGGDLTGEKDEHGHKIPCSQVG